MAKRVVLLALALVGLAVVVRGAARAAATPPWYDASPLLASIRADARPALVRALGVTRLDDLTLYDLDVVYDAPKASFTLSEDVWFTNTTDTTLTDLVFRVYANAAPPPSGPPVRFLSGACGGDARCGFDSPTPSAVRVKPFTPLAPGDRLQFTLRFTGSLTRIDSSRTNMMAQSLEGLEAMFGGAGGAGASGGDYGILGVGDGIVSFGNFYAVLARRSGAVWEVDEKSKLGDLGSDRMASFRARVELPARAKLGVTGVVTSEQPIAAHPERREVRVVAAAIRDFAMLFGDAVESSSREVNGTVVRSFYLGADRAAGARVLDAAAHALEDLERRFGPYPYAHLDVCEAAIVGGAGGVEFSGLVTAASMFYRPATGGAAAGSADGLGALLGQLGGLGGGLGGMTEGMLEFVVAHEVAHQWWHGLVGSDSRDHPYVDEALAQYSAMLYLEDRYGPARADKDGDVNAKMGYQTMRMLGSPDAPVDRPVAAFASSVEYAGLVYGKAPYFYKALRHAVGDAAFFGALKQYVQRYRFREAPPRGFVDLVAQTAGDAKVRALERHWLVETHGDEDLGQLDLSSMLGPLLGGAGGAGLGDMDELLKSLQGAGTAPGAAPRKGNAPKGGGDVDLDKLLQDLGGD